MALRVDTDFPGGNALVERIEGDTVYLRPDLRDTQGHWFYWYLRLRGAAGRTVSLRFAGGPAIGVRGPAMSTDGGDSWRWLGPGSGTRDWCRVAVPLRVDDCRLSFAMPYQLAHWRRFLARLGRRPLLRPGTLCRSRGGRDVPVLRVGSPSAHTAIVVCARHHACEMMANYAIEGMLEAILDRVGAAAWLADRAEILAIPFVDLDGVEAGDQGKNRQPRDHNRDYDATPVHREVAAIRHDIPTWGGARLRAFISLHCPHIEGPHNECIYQVGQAPPEIWRAQQRFGAVLEAGRGAVLPYRQADDLAWGEEWNTARNYAEGLSAEGWAAELPEIRLSTSIEIPYANVRGYAVTPGGCRGFGRDLAAALGRYLREP